MQESRGLANAGDGQKRWPWYEQIVDAACAVAGLSIIMYMAYGQTWHYLGVLTALALLGYISARSLTRWLVGRINGNESK